MKKILSITLLVLMFISCKDIDKTIEILSNAKYKEVVFTKNYKRNSDVSELNISYKNYLFKFRFVEDITLLHL